METDIKTGKVYDFSTLYPAVLGSKKVKQTCIGENFTLEAANNFGNDNARILEQIKALADRDDDILNQTPNSLSYYLFKDSTTGYINVLAKEYIDISTIVESGEEHTFKVFGLSPVDVKIIRGLLTKHGYSYTVE